MTLLALIIALILEQIYPLGRNNRAWKLFVNYLDYVKRNCNSGLLQHGVLAWLVAVVPVLLFVLFVQLLLNALNQLIGLCWEVLALYLTMGFRHFSSSFSDLSRAINDGRVFDARDALSRWTGRCTSDLSISEMVGLAIEQGVLDSYRHVFATMFWFAAFGVFGFGSVGAVLYQLTSLVQRKWNEGGRDINHHFASVSGLILDVFDWLPVRVTAASFAVMGNFEDAIYLWRAQLPTWNARMEKILLASASGAIGVKLGELSKVQNVYSPAELSLNQHADTSHMKSAVGLVWRSVILWCFVMLLMTVVHLIS